MFSTLTKDTIFILYPFLFFRLKGISVFFRLLLKAHLDHHLLRNVHLGPVVPQSSHWGP